MDEQPPTPKQEEQPQKLPQIITIELTIPTRESVLDGIKALFPTVDVKVVDEEEPIPKNP